MFVSILVLIMSTVLTVVGHWYLHNCMIRIAKGKYRSLAAAVIICTPLPGWFSANLVGEYIGLTDFQATLPGMLWFVVFWGVPIFYEIFRKDEKK